jgi:hypothetical protein
VHWVATTAVTQIASEIDTQRRQKSDRSVLQKYISLVPPSAGHAPVLEREDAVDRTASGSRTPSTGFAPLARAVDRYRSVYPGWLALAWRATAKRWTIWRREWDIKAAVAALSDHDDRTLQDMGIPHRSQIEQIVRNGRDS